MKKMLAFILIFSYLLSACQSAAGVNQESGIPVTGPYDKLLMGSTETKTPFLPVANGYFETVTTYNNNPVAIDNLNNQSDTPENGFETTTETTKGAFSTASLQASSIVPVTTGSKAPLTQISKTATSNVKSITITEISYMRTRRAYLGWQVNGEFPHGFYVIWSATNTTPTYPDDKYVTSTLLWALDVKGTEGETYYFRVCENTGDGIGICSPVRQFTYTNFAATGTASIKSIFIAGVGYEGPGQARISWNTFGDFPEGFRLVWSTYATGPSYPYHPSIFVSSGERSVVFSGTPGQRYFFTVCEVIGDACGVESNHVEYLMKGELPTETIDPLTITITSVTESEPGKAVVNWRTQNGLVPSSFFVVWSQSTTSPVFPGNDYIITRDWLRTAIISGQSGQTIHIRVCKNINEYCGVYSNSYTFTFSSVAATSTPIPPTATVIPPTATLIPTSTFTDVPIIVEETTEVPAKESGE